MAGSNRWRNWRRINFKIWLERNISGCDEGDEQNEWPRTFAITAWWIWRWRNDRIFNASSMEVQRKIAWIKEAEEEIGRAFMRDANMRNINSTEKVLRLKWNPSSDHRYTINVDGSVKATSKIAGIGGVIRNERGEWMEGFVERVDYGDASMIEARAIVKGMDWAWKKGIRDVEIQSDAKNVINWITTGVTLRGPIQADIQAAREWLNKGWKISIRAIYREQNRVADTLSILGTRQQNEWTTLSTCPPESEEVFFHDLARVVCCRRVRETN